MPSKVLNFKTLLQVLLSYVSLPVVLLIPPRVLDCIVFTYLHKNQRSKLDPFADRYIFLGYALYKKGYHCYDPITKCTYVTMDATFLELDTFFPPPLSTSSLQGQVQNEEQNLTKFE